MIGKHIPSPKGHSSFKGLNDYITGKTNRQPEEKIAFTGCLNLISLETATVEMESLASLNKRCADPVMHLLLSWRENETPTTEQADEAVRIALDELNLSQCQAVYALHQNTDNLHLHICVNRIDPDTHKAIDPAHGWTRREHAARRIEYLQGWQTEQNTWSTVNENGEVVQKPKKEDSSIPLAVSDMEHLTGEQSAIRRAQEVLRGTIKKLSSWEEFHNTLALHGMQYQKKGSGAVIVVGDVTVKASSVSKNLTLSKLEKQLGPFQEIHRLAQLIFDDKAPSACHRHEPLDNTHDNENWRAYIAERGEHYNAIKSLKTKHSTSLQKTREILKARHMAERGELLDTLRKSHPTRAFMNQQRAALASRHAYERAVLNAEQKRRREEQKRLTAKFPPFEQWLRDKDLSEEADLWRHRRDKSSLLLECPEMESVPLVGTEPLGILGFTMHTARGGTRFSREASPERAAFIDRGKVIRVYEQDDETLLAALQLGQQKWGGVQLNGSDEYKQRCAEIAAKNGIRVTNPELQDISVVAKDETPEEKAQRMEEEYETLNRLTKALITKCFPAGGIMVSDAQNERQYDGVLLGMVSHGGRTLALLEWVDNRVIRLDVRDKEMLRRLESCIGNKVVLTYRDWFIAQMEESRPLDYSRSVRRGR